MKDRIRCSKAPILSPVSGCEWADTMVLNPAIFKDENSDDILMLFRATGPYEKKKRPEATLPPFPIFLGFAKSSDNGETWDADFSRPCLAPKLEYEKEKIKIKNTRGEYVTDFSNGCIEDPRVFKIDGKTYLTVACRLFPPGPYWDISAWKNGHGKYDHSIKNIPDWAFDERNDLGAAASENLTVTVLYELNVEKLKQKEYDNAFTYVCALTDANRADNRDVCLFPEKMMIDDKLQYVMLHRPINPNKFDSNISVTTPSIMIACAEKLEDFYNKKSKDILLATGEFKWSSNRIGTSYTPIKIDEKRWLLPVHGSDEELGYTQTFYILENVENSFPKITHKCSDRLMYASQEWEMPDLYPQKCIFATGGIIVDGELIISYGAADQYCGIAKVNFEELVNYVMLFDADGKKI